MLVQILDHIWHHILWIGGLGLAFGAVEYYWNKDRRPTLAARVGNILIVVFAMIAMGLVEPYLSLFHGWFASHSLFGMVFGEWHPNTIASLIAAAVVYAFVWDFFQYWFHRAEHRFEFLWPVHSLHHDDEMVNWTTSQRNTFWSAIFHFFLVNIPTLIVCGVELLPIAGAYFFFLGYGLFNHANIRLNLRWMTPIISGPQWHRIHHGRDEQYYNKNFAAFFPVLDLIFGTYRGPAANEYPETGLADRPQATLSASHLVRNVFGFAGKAPLPTR